MKYTSNSALNLDKIELNEKFLQSLSVINGTGKSVFITGKAGTGKSTFIEYFRHTTEKNIVVLAPTGVAALNVSGETIHSFFGFKPDITVRKIKKIRTKKADILQNLDAIVIDEISMVRADLLDCVDRSLRLNGKKRNVPFGGIQMVFIGDLYQLPPVVTEKEKEAFSIKYEDAYFFSSDVFRNFPVEFIELEKVYRQKDEAFINLLNSIRNNSIEDEGLALLNKRVGAVFGAERKGGYAVHLTTLNRTADEINREHLDKLRSELNVPIHAYRAEIFGNFDRSSYPAEQELMLSVRAQVMLLNNEPKGRWVNGTLGEVVEIKPDDETGNDIICVKLADGGVVQVYPYAWRIFHYTFNKLSGTIETDEIGSFSQYPIRLAWAITIHKSQGKTFDRVIVDLSRGTFAHGQAYVALSRCTSLEGISLKSPVKKNHILMDWRVVRFLTGYQYGISERDMPFDEKLKLIRRAIESGSMLEITYLKASDEKSRRVIKPLSVGKRNYKNKSFIGVDCYCMKRDGQRVFRVDRILEMKFV